MGGYHREIRHPMKAQFQALGLGLLRTNNGALFQNSPFRLWLGQVIISGL